jgi:hypothetical protein
MPTRLEIESLRAERDYHLARAAVLNEQLAASAAIDLSQYDPSWKTPGTRLSRAGRAAIMAAFDQFMPQNEVSALFQISSTSAHKWHRRWKQARRLAGDEETGSRAASEPPKLGRGHPGGALPRF